MTTPELEAIRWEVLAADSMRRQEITYGPQLSSLLTDGAGNGGALHLTLGVDDL